MRTVSVFFLFLISILSSAAQSKGDLRFIDASTLDIIGKAEISPNHYHRIDTSKYSNLPSRVSYLATNSAGLAVSFKTNAKRIYLKWCVDRGGTMPYLTPVNNNGFDLYIKVNEKWQFAGSASTTAACNEQFIVNNMVDGERECLLFLPTYKEVKSLEIGFDRNAYLETLESPFKKRVVVYGSSIVQGASASRPGMSYTNKLSRMTGYHFINLGFSGSAKMEPEVADMLAEISADAFVLDCVPNSNPSQITERTNQLVKKIRKNHPDAPIIILQSLIREHGYFNKIIENHVKDQNVNILNEVIRLVEEGDDKIHFITSENWLGNDYEGTIDGTHPNDLGMDRMLNIIGPNIVKILKNYQL